MKNEETNKENEKENMAPLVDLICRRILNSHYTQIFCKKYLRVTLIISVFILSFIFIRINFSSSSSPFFFFSSQTSPSKSSFVLVGNEKLKRDSNLVNALLENEMRNSYFDEKDPANKVIVDSNTGEVLRIKKKNSCSWMMKMMKPTKNSNSNESSISRTTKKHLSCRISCSKKLRLVKKSTPLLSENVIEALQQQQQEEGKSSSFSSLVLARQDYYYQKEPIENKDFPCFSIPKKNNKDSFDSYYSSQIKDPKKVQKLENHLHHHQCRCPAPFCELQTTVVNSRDLTSKTVILECKDSPSFVSSSSSSKKVTTTTTKDQEKESQKQDEEEHYVHHEDELVCVGKEQGDERPKFLKSKNTPIQDITNVEQNTQKQEENEIKVIENVQKQFQNFKRHTSWLFRRWFDWGNNKNKNTNNNNNNDKNNNKKTLSSPPPKFIPPPFDNGAMTGSHDPLDGVYRWRNVCLRSQGKPLGYDPSHESYRGSNEYEPLQGSALRSVDFRNFVKDVEVLANPPSHVLDGINVLMIPLDWKSESSQHFLYRAIAARKIAKEMFFSSSSSSTKTKSKSNLNNNNFHVIYVILYSSFEQRQQLVDGLKYYYQLIGESWSVIFQKEVSSTTTKKSVQEQLSVISSSSSKSSSWREQLVEDLHQEIVINNQHEETITTTTTTTLQETDDNDDRDMKRNETSSSFSTTKKNPVMALLKHHHHHPIACFKEIIISQVCLGGCPKKSFYDNSAAAAAGVSSNQKKTGSQFFFPMIHIPKYQNIEDVLTLKEFRANVMLPCLRGASSTTTTIETTNDNKVLEAEYDKGMKSVANGFSPSILFVASPPAAASSFASSSSSQQNNHNNHNNPPHLFDLGLSSTIPEIRRVLTKLSENLQQEEVEEEGEIKELSVSSSTNQKNDKNDKQSTAKKSHRYYSAIAAASTASKQKQTNALFHSIKISSFKVISPLLESPRNMLIKILESDMLVATNSMLSSSSFPNNNNKNQNFLNTVALGFSWLLPPKAVVVELVVGGNKNALCRYSGVKYSYSDINVEGGWNQQSVVNNCDIAGNAKVVGVNHFFILLKDSSVMKIHSVPSSKKTFSTTTSSKHTLSDSSSQILQELKTMHSDSISKLKQLEIEEFYRLKHVSKVLLKLSTKLSKKSSKLQEDLIVSLREKSVGSSKKLKLSNYQKNGKDRNDDGDALKQQEINNENDDNNDIYQQKEKQIQNELQKAVAKVVSRNSLPPSSSSNTISNPAILLNLKQQHQQLQLSADQLRLLQKIPKFAPLENTISSTYLQSNVVAGVFLGSSSSSLHNNNNNYNFLPEIFEYVSCRLIFDATSVSSSRKSNKQNNKIIAQMLPPRCLRVLFEPLIVKIKKKVFDDSTAANSTKSNKKKSQAKKHEVVFLDYASSSSSASSTASEGKISLKDSMRWKKKMNFNENSLTQKFLQILGRWQSSSCEYGFDV